MHYIVTIIILALITVGTLCADTIIMKDRKEIKGLVVDEYIDRITLGTIDGEKNILRKDIENVKYDTPEQNFMQLGRAYDTKGWHDKAAFYYKKAMDVNPDYKEAREAYLVSHAKMWRQEERMTRKELDRQSMIMNWQRNRNKEAQKLHKDKALLLKKTIGILLLKKDEVFTVDKVEPYSSAAKAGIEEGDILVSIWGKRIRYSKMKEVIDELLGPKFSEVRVLIEKDILVSTENMENDLYKKFGMSLEFKYEGLAINDIISGGKAELAGLRDGDFVVAIDKNITRYLLLDSAISLINSSKEGKDILFTIRRNVNLRRKDE